MHADIDADSVAPKEIRRVYHKVRSGTDECEAREREYLVAYDTSIAHHGADAARLAVQSR